MAHVADELAARPVARGVSLRLPVAASVLLHAGLVAAIVLLRPAALPPSRPVYRVNLLAAPPGPRTAGVVQPAPAVVPPEAATAPVRPRTAPTAMPLPTAKRTPTVKAATPSTPTTPPSTAPAPAAGGGPTGGRGTDVATVATPGIEFPYPGYLTNIVSQVARRFEPPRGSALRADVSFLIRRDGTVPRESIRLVTRSGVYAFDLEAQGAIEAAANARAFGPLPAGYPDDVLPVTFRFDPRFLR